MIVAYRLDIEEADVSYSSGITEEWKQKVGGYYTTKEIIWDKLIAFVSENPSYLDYFLCIHTNRDHKVKNVVITITYEDRWISFNAKWEAAKLVQTHTTEKIVVDGIEYFRRVPNTEIKEFEKYSIDKKIYIQYITISEETTDSKPQSFTIEKENTNG